MTEEDKIQFLVQKWLDEAQLETILEYAGEKLEEYYQDLNPEVVSEMYEESLEV